MVALNRVWAVVPAAGVGARMGQALPKQYLSLNGITVAEHTLSRLLAVSRIEKIVVPVADNDPYWHELIGVDHQRVVTCTGGAERCESVRNGLQALDADDMDWVLVHDVARPCIRASDVVSLINQLADDHVGGLLAVPVRDTMKRADSSSKLSEARDNNKQLHAVVDTVSRQDLWHALTPQLFRYGLLKQALDKAIETRVMVTDEAQALELMGYVPKLVEGSQDNLKITFPKDLQLASFYLKQQESEGDDVQSAVMPKNELSN